MAKATTIRKTFSRQTSVSIDIQAEPKTIWEMLTASECYPSWNSTVLDLKGKIALGEKIKLISYLDPKRVFTLSIKSLEPERRLVWGDAMGRREFTLTPTPYGVTTFSMTEKIGGPFFPFFAKMIPPFDEAFEQFAKDLKTASEKTP